MNATITFHRRSRRVHAAGLYSKENRAKLVYLVEAKPAASIAVRLNPGQPVDITLPKT